MRRPCQRTRPCESFEILNIDHVEDNVDIGYFKYQGYGKKRVVWKLPHHSWAKETESATQQVVSQLSTKVIINNSKFTGSSKSFYLMDQNYSDLLYGERKNICTARSWNRNRRLAHAPRPLFWEIIKWDNWINYRGFASCASWWGWMCLMGCRGY